MAYSKLFTEEMWGTKDCRIKGEEWKWDWNLCEKEKLGG